MRNHALPVIVGCLTLALLAPEMAVAAPDTSGIPPKRLLLIFPVIVLIIIAVLLVKTRRR